VTESSSETAAGSGSLQFHGAVAVDAIANEFDFAAVVAPDGSTRYLSEKSARVLGVNLTDEDSIISSGLFSFVCEEDRSRWSAGVRAGLDGTEWRGPISFLSGDGRANIDCRMIPLPGAGLKGDSVLVVGSNLSLYEYPDFEQRKMERVVSTSNIPFAVGTIEGVITYVNEACVKMWRFASASEMIGREIASFWRDRSVVHEVGEAVRSFGEWSGELMAQRTDGEEMILQVTVNTVEDDEGKRAMMVASFVDVTKRIQDRRELVQSQKRLIQAQRIAKVGFWEWDIVANTLYWSDEIFRIAGIADTEFASNVEAFFELVHPDDRDAVRQKLEGALSEAIPYEIDHRMVRPTGEVRFVEEQGEVTFGSDGKPIRMLGTVADITEKKLAEASLRETESRLKTVIDQVSVILWATDKEGIFTLSEGSGLLVLGLEPGQVVGQSVFDLYRDFPDLLGDIERVLSGEFVDATRDVGPVTFQVRHSPLLDENGVVVGAMGVATDVTAQKAAERILQEREERFRSLIENAPDLIIVINGDGSIEFRSPSVERLTGFTADEREGGTALDLIAEEDRDDVREALAYLFENPGNTRSVVSRFKTKSGDWRVIESKGAVKVFADGVPRAIVNARDVTERVTAEEERRVLENQLRQSQKLETIGTLAGGIAHDFNNLLQSILGFSEMCVQAVEEGSKVHRNLGRIVQAAERAKDLVRQILTFSRAVEQDRGPIRLSLVVRETLDLLQGSLPSTIDIREDFRDDLGMILGDPTQMQQVVMNVCTNSYKAMGGSPGVLTVRLSRVGAEELPDDITRQVGRGDFLLLSISDTGEGMDAKTKERIFEPFFTTAGPGRGTGLGLSVVHGIVASHGGVIDVQSELGQGTTVDVYFPVYSGRISGENESAAAEYDGNERILFIDDDPMIGQLIEQGLAAFGYWVRPETDAVEAFEIFREGPGFFDVLVTDQTMPKKSGLELAREIREIRSDVPIILVTGYSETASEAACADIGIDEMLMKPFSVKDLAISVRRVLNHRDK